MLKKEPRTLIAVSILVIAVTLITTTISFILRPPSKTFIHRTFAEVEILYNTELDRCWIKGRNADNYLSEGRGACVLELGLK